MAQRTVSLALPATVALIFIGPLCPLLVKLQPLTSPFSNAYQFRIVYANESDFVLRNASVQLTISDGRITSLVDVQQGCVPIEVNHSMAINWVVI
jgi:hypothetical protein